MIQEPGHDLEPLGEPAPHDGEMSGLVRRHAAYHPAPERLVDHFYRLAEEERRENRWQMRRFWQASFAGALAASLTLAVGFFGIDRLLDSKDPYDLVAEEAKTTSRRADTFPVAVQDRIEAKHKARLDKLFTAFNKDFRYQQKVPLSGGKSEIVLEGATLREVDGRKIAHLVYRMGDARLHLNVIPAEDNTEWPGFLRHDGWVTMNDDSPRTFVWRKGAFIYAMVGDLPLERFREFSAAIAQR